MLFALGGALAALAERSTTTKPPQPVERVEEVAFRRDGKLEELTGRLVIEASDGGVVLQNDEGIQWTIEGSNIVSRQQLDKPFTPITSEALAERLVAEMPGGFRIHQTPHYVVCYNTSREYAQWTSSLLERLYKAFTNYWQHQGFELHEPEFPLAVMVFADRALYNAASRDDLPGGTGGIIGFYSLRSNRVNMFDLTGTEAVRGPGSRRGSTREINQMLSQPAAVPLVATIVHEATHQIAFNCGLQTRFADIPLWLCEGMAVYFEAPDLASTRGWRGIGRVNYPRLETFQQNLDHWQSSGQLAGMLANDDRFRDPRRAVDAYADAWALNYYLIKYQPDKYTAYLKMLAAKPPFAEDSPQTRLEEFRAHFGELGQLQGDFLKQMSQAE
ncbi:MAG: DUF1570 domain-containing protein [Planctomycetes bacterium]|nr:DUF1570 domain-containing protein [Planctomycetota bacterium]